MKDDFEIKKDTSANKVVETPSSWTVSKEDALKHRQLMQDKYKKYKKRIEDQ